MLYIIILFVALTTDTTEIKLYSNTLYLYLSLMNLSVTVLMRIFIAYRFPLLFIGWAIISDTLFNKIVTKCYTYLLSFVNGINVSYKQSITCEAKHYL